MNKIKIILYILAIPLGALMFVYAGVDDSPGGQLLGVIVGIIGIVGLIKMNKKRKENKKCPLYPIDITDDREVVDCDKLKFDWKADRKGYFLVKIEKDLIHCGFVNPKHKMIIELKGKYPDKIIKEIVKRKLCNLANMGYIASELMIAHYAIKNKKKYIQR